MEFKIYIKDTDKEYVNGLMLGLIYSGYEVYFDWGREHIVFTGNLDEVCPNHKAITNDI